MSFKDTLGQPLEILLIEDNEDHAELIKRSFEEHRVINRITHISDGEQALEYFDKLLDNPGFNPSDLPQVVLLDLRLPKVDGLEILKRIRNTENLEKLPVVILTTSTAEIDVAKAYEENANSYLVKPVDFDKFTELMEVLGYYWLCWNRSPFFEP